MDFVRFVRSQWDRVAAWVCVAVGALALLLGWLGVSDTGFPAEQIPYIISGGLVGIFLLGLGAALWLSADLRDEWRKLDAIERLLREKDTVVVVADRAESNGQVRVRASGALEAAEVDRS